MDTDEVTTDFVVLSIEAGRLRAEFEDLSVTAVRDFAKYKRDLIHETLIVRATKALELAHSDGLSIAVRADYVGQAAGFIEAARIVRMAL